MFKNMLILFLGCWIYWLADGNKVSYWLKKKATGFNKSWFKFLTIISIDLILHPRAERK